MCTAFAHMRTLTNIHIHSHAHRTTLQYYRFGGGAKAAKGNGKYFGNLSSTEVNTFVQQTGELLVLSYLTDFKVNQYPSVKQALESAVGNLNTCLVGIFDVWVHSAHTSDTHYTILHFAFTHS